MDLTTSFTDCIDEHVRARYELRETRNAAAILAATDPDAFGEIIGVLRNFVLTHEDMTTPGGSKSLIARKLDEAFRALGWREARVDTEINSHLKVHPWSAGGERGVTTRTTTVYNEGYKVDNFKRRIALDVEWNAKDGNLDRDLGAYRAMYDMGFIDGAVMITRTMNDIRALNTYLSNDKRLDSTTTTNLVKLRPRMTRGDAGGCPFLAIAITARCFDASYWDDLAPELDVDELLKHDEERAVAEERVSVSDLIAEDPE